MTTTTESHRPILTTVRAFNPSFWFAAAGIVAVQALVMANYTGTDPAHIVIYVAVSWVLALAFTAAAVRVSWLRRQLGLPACRLTGCDGFAWRCCGRCLHHHGGVRS